MGTGPSANDRINRGWKKYNLTATTGNDITSGIGGYLMAISCTAAAATTTLVVANAATVTGTDLWHMQSLASGGTVYESFSPAGIRFTALSYTLAGSGGLGEIYVMLDE